MRILSRSGQLSRSRLSERQMLRRGVARRTVIVAAIVVGVGGLWYWLSAMSRQQMYADKISVARKQLQLSRNEESLKTLSLTSDTDAPPEFRYLKALTLDRLRRYEPANAEIRRAIAAAPNDPKYKGLELKFRMLARERSAVEQLIELNRDHASIAAVALFAAYGFKAKAMLLESDGKPESAEYHEQRRKQTLDTAITMSADIPELHPELLTFAIREGLPNEALGLLDGLLKLDPDSLPLRSQKVRVFVALKRVDDAARLAAALYEETNRNIKGAEYFATVLAQAKGNEERDTAFEEMVSRFPRSTMVVSKYAVYLTKTGRMPAAQKQIAKAIDRQTDLGERETLAFVSITLPLEVNAPAVAEEYLRKNRKHLQDELLVDYFEARILYLRNQFGEAMRKMLHIVSVSRKNKSGSRVFATEALTWIRRILAEKVMTEQLDRVLDATIGPAEPSGLTVKIATEEQLKALEKKSTGQPAPGSLSVKEDPKSPPATDSPAGSVAPSPQQPNESSPTAE